MTEIFYMKIIRPEVWGHWLNEKILVGSSKGCRVESTPFFISYSCGGRVKEGGKFCKAMKRSVVNYLAAAGSNRTN
jgi:hypothetical protein